MSKIQYSADLLNMLGYFRVPSTSTFLCNLAGCSSKIRITSSGFAFLNSTTNTVSVLIKPNFESLVDHVLDFQYKNAPYEYFERKSTFEQGAVLCTSVLCSTYVCAKTKRQSSREISNNLIRVKSSNIWSYGVQTELGRNTCDLYVQFKNSTGGPGDVYQYFDFPLRAWKKFITAPSKGHFFWKYVRSNYRYRKLTGDKRGKMPNAIN